MASPPLPASVSEELLRTIAHAVAPDQPSLTDHISAYSSVAAAIVAVATFVLLLIELSKLTDQTAREARAYKAQMLLELSERWTAILPKRYNVMQATRNGGANKILVKDGSKRPYEEFFNDEFWKSNLRDVLNFYETLGLLIYRDYISWDEAFVLVSVDNFDDDSDKGRTIESAKFYQSVKPILEYLRDGYRPDIYDFYDGFLLTEYCRQDRLRPKPLAVAHSDQASGRERFRLFHRS